MSRACPRAAAVTRHTLPQWPRITTSCSYRRWEIGMRAAAAAGPGAMGVVAMHEEVRRRSHPSPSLRAVMMRTMTWASTLTGTAWLT